MGPLLKTFRRQASADDVKPHPGKLDALKKAFLGRFTKPGSAEALPPSSQPTPRSEEFTSLVPLVAPEDIAPGAGKFHALKKALFEKFTKPRSPEVLPPSSQTTPRSEDTNSQVAPVTPVDVTPGSGKFGAWKKALFGRFARPRPEESTKRVSLDDIARVAGEPGSLKEALVGGFLKPGAADARPLRSRAMSRVKGITRRASPARIVAGLVKQSAEAAATVELKKHYSMVVASVLGAIAIAGLTLLLRWDTFDLERLFDPFLRYWSQIHGWAIDMAQLVWAQAMAGIVWIRGLL